MMFWKLRLMALLLSGNHIEGQQQEVDPQADLDTPETDQHRYHRHDRIGQKPGAHLAAVIGSDELRQHPMLPARIDPLQKKYPADEYQVASEDKRGDLGLWKGVQHAGGKRQQRDEHEEQDIQPEQGPVGAPDGMVHIVMPDPEDAQADKA